MRIRIGNLAFPTGNDRVLDSGEESPPGLPGKNPLGRTFPKFILLIWMAAFAASWSFGQQPSTDSDLALYKEAVELIDKEKYGAAQVMLDQYIQRNAHPYDGSARNDRVAEARFYHAFAAYNLLHSNAQSLFEEFIEAYPSHPRVDESRFYIGSLYFMRKEYDKVLPYLRAVDHSKLKREQVVQSRFMMGYCFYKEGRNREAMSHFRQIQNEKGQYGELGAYYFALISYENGNFSEAYSAFNKISPDNSYAKNIELYKASCLLKLKRYDELDKLAYELEASGKGGAEVWFIFGNSAFERGKYAKSIDYFKRFEGSRGGSLNREGQYRMGYSFYMTQDYASARTRFQKCLNPEDDVAQNAYYYLGHCFLKIDNYESARTAFMKAADMKFNPEIQEEALFLYAKASFQTRYFEEALSALQRMMEEYPGSAHREESTGLIGEILLYTNNFKEAIEYLENEDGLSTQRSKASYQRACYLYGLQLYRQGVYDMSADYFKKAYNQNQAPEITRDSYFWYAEALFRTQGYGEAISAYNTFLRQPYASKTKEYALAYYGLGWSHLKRKNYDESGKNFEKFIGLADKKNNGELYVDALLRAGDCEFALKNYKGALRYYGQVRDFNTMHVDYALFQIGLLHFRQSDYKRAAEAHVRLAANYRKSEYRDDALITAAETYLTWLNDQRNCAKYCRVLIRDHKDSPFVPSALARLAISEERSGNKELAIKFYKQVVYDHCNSTANVTVALSSLSNLLRANDYDRVEAQYREKCPNAGGGGNSEMEGLAIEVADSRFFEDNFASAKDKYSNYIADYPQGSQLYHAHYYRGQCYEKLGDAEEAMEDYEFIYRSEQSNAYTVKALKSAADMLYNQENYLAAMELYTAMEERSDKLADRLGAQFGKAQVHLANGDYASAKVEFMSIYSDQNTTDYSRKKARVQVAACEYFLGNRDDAFQIFSEIEKEETNVFGAESQYYITRILFDRGEYEQSKNAGIYLKDQYPGYNYWKAKAYLVVAEDYLALGDTFQAVKGTLESLASQGAFPDVQQAAQQRIDELNAFQGDEGNGLNENETNGGDF